MKNILILSVLGFLCLLLANAKISQKDLDQLIALENIEALASGEGDSGIPCYGLIDVAQGGLLIYCPDCSLVEDYKPIGLPSVCRHY